MSEEIVLLVTGKGEEWLAGRKAWKAKEVTVQWCCRDDAVMQR